MSLLPDSERILLGPGPSPVSPRVMRALTAPVLGHLDPKMLAILDNLRARLHGTFRAPEGSFSFAVSGTGTAGMETAVNALIKEGVTALVVVTGYFGERLVEMCRRYGAIVHRVDAEWGRAVDPEAVRKALRAQGADVVAMVHAETSTGVLNPAETICQIAAEQGSMTIVDTVTSLGGHPVDVASWGADAVYSGSQKALGAPSGMAPVCLSARTLSMNSGRNFYLDTRLLHDYWVGRKYHHTISAPLVYALAEALVVLDEEGLDHRWARHRRHHQVLVAGLEAMGLHLLPPASERLWTLNTIRIPEGVDDVAVRQFLLKECNMEIGAGLGPLAGRIWRVGFMGAGSTSDLVLLFLKSLERALKNQGHAITPGTGIAAAEDMLSTAR